MRLSSLLDDGARFDAGYRGGWRKHLPMALLALERLGADETMLDAFAAVYQGKLEAAPADKPWPAGDAWRGRFGDRAAWPVCRSLFNEWMVFESAPWRRATSRALVLAGLCDRGGLDAAGALQAELLERAGRRSDGVARRPPDQAGVKLLKIAAAIVRNTRRVRVLLASSHPKRAVFASAAHALAP